MSFADNEIACLVKSYRNVAVGDIELVITEEREDGVRFTAMFTGVAKRTKSGIYQTSMIELTNLDGKPLSAFGHPRARISFEVIQADSEKIVIKGKWDEWEDELYEFTGVLFPRSE